MDHKKIKWGIIGLGGIAKKFASDIQLLDDCELVAVASRSQEKANAFAKEFSVENAFGHYQGLFGFEGIDAVYIATPHDSHAELSIKALKQGKHVLCEKPVTVNGTQLKEVLAVAKKENRFFMEAMWSRFIPAILEAKSIVDKGILGSVNYVNADFNYYGMDRGDESRLLNPDLAGGSILDIGIYPIFFSYFMLGKPEKIWANTKFHDTGVEVNTAMVFMYENAQAILHSGFDSHLQVEARISGTQGTIALTPSWHNAQGYCLSVGDETTVKEIPTIGIGYSHEIIEVNDCIRSGKLESDKWSHQNSIDLMELMDEVRNIVQAKYPFE